MRLRLSLLLTEPTNLGEELNFFQTFLTSQEGIYPFLRMIIVLLVTQGIGTLYRSLSKRAIQKTKPNAAPTFYIILGLR